MTIRESKVESDIRKYAEKRGWWQCKFTSPSLRGVPDRIFIRAGRHVFIEVKRPGKKATAQQKKRHVDMREKGAEVYVIDCVEDAYAILE
ncbi:endonuclease [Pseudomonas phage UF_RH7]|nr:endonuclease [Pseudomonas phage UF_RH7]